MSFGIKIGLYIGFGVLVILALLVAFGVITPFKSSPPGGELLIWDRNDRRRLFDGWVQRYQAAFPAVKVIYEAKSPETYKGELLNALAAGQGPDIFVLSNQEFLDNKTKIKPLASNLSQAKSFLEHSPDAVLEGLTDVKNIYGVPLTLDTLALYYNKDYLNAANIPAPPQTWEEFQDQSRRLTKSLTGGGILRSGAALGAARNVEHAADIFFALMLQSANPIFTAADGKFHLEDRIETTTGTEAAGLSALKFYTDFANPRSLFYTWTASLPEAQDAFASGQAAFYIGYAGDFGAILEKNPHLNFGVARLPQLDPESRVSYASYEFFTVARNSQNPDLAWAFVLTLSDPTVSEPISKSLLIPPADRNLAVKPPPNKILQPWYDQVLSAKSWPIFARDAALKIFRDMLDSVVERGVSPADAISRAQSQLQVLAGDLKRQ